MTATQTGIAKGTLWVFYREAQEASYTPIIKVSWHAAGVVPYSPDAGLTRLPGYGASRSVPKVSTTPRAFKLSRSLSITEAVTGRRLVLSGI